MDWEKGAPMPTYQTLTEGLYNTAVGKSFLVKGIEYIKWTKHFLWEKTRERITHMALILEKCRVSKEVSKIRSGRFIWWLGRCLRICLWWTDTMNAILDLLRLESSNMQVSNSVLKLEEFHGYKKKWRNLRNTITKGFAESLCREIAYKYMNTDYTATRMLGYLYRMTELKEEQLVDEMIAILEDRDRIIKNMRWNRHRQPSIGFIMKGWNKLVSLYA